MAKMFELDAKPYEKGKIIFTQDDLVRNKHLFKPEEYLDIALALSESHIVEYHNLGHTILVVDKTESNLVLAHFNVDRNENFSILEYFNVVKEKENHYG